MCKEMMICRLCLSKNFLNDLYKLDELCAMITSVTGLELQRGDSLPSLICVSCERNIKIFNKFKKTCLEVDLKLRAKIKNPINATQDFIKDEQNPNNKCENGKIVNYSWLDDDTKYDINPKLEEITGLKQVQDDKTSIKQNNYKCTKTEKEQQKFQCDVCGNIYKNKCSLKTHITTHTGVKRYSCPICHKTFTRAAHKVVHVRAHMGIRPFVCEICGASTTKRQDLNRHLRVHSDEKNYPCPVCDKRFKRSSDVRTHLRAHTLARPFKCVDCDKCYKSQGALLKHYRTHCKKEQTEKKKIKQITFCVNNQ